MNLSPPRGSKIQVASDGAGDVIRIPYRAEPARFLIGAFLLCWFGGWAYGFSSVSRQILSGAGNAFLIFWLAGWSFAGLAVLYVVYRIFRPSVSETLTLRSEGMTYDSGVAPFQPRFGGGGFGAPRDWRSNFSRRTVVDLSRAQLQTMRLREAAPVNRLTVDRDSERLEIGRAASEVEREWLYGELKRRFA